MPLLLKCKKWIHNDRRYEIDWENTTKLFCHNCGNDITTPINQYGTIHNPVCQACFFECKTDKEIEQEISWLRFDIDDLEFEKDKVEDKIYELERKIKEIKDEQDEKLRLVFA